MSQVIGSHQVGSRFPAATGPWTLGREKGSASFSTDIAILPSLMKD
jgi:hypothetical protein